MAQDDVQNISAFLPPCHEDADRPEHVYKFEDSILSVSQWFLMPLTLNKAIWHVGASQAFVPHRPRAGSKVMLPWDFGVCKSLICHFPVESRMLCLLVGSIPQGTSVRLAIQK